MKFAKDYLKEVLYDDVGEIIENKIIEISRWTVNYRMIFKTEDGGLFETFYESGATEMQDQQPYEYDDDEIECSEVKPVKTVVTIYERI